MKKMLSLAAMLAVLSYASPASAELKFGGDASVRMRTEFNDINPGDKADDIKFQYRVRLKAAADLGSGYFFKTMLMNEDNVAGGWQSVAYGNSERITPDISNFYFGRMMADSHYMMGRIPLNTFNNPIMDLTLYPMQALDTPVFNINYDRGYGANYGTKLGDGELSATILVLDNEAPTSGIGSDGRDGLFNDGYGIHLSYKTTVGNVTIEPQMITTLGDSDVWNQTNAITYHTTNYTSVKEVAAGLQNVIFAPKVTPWTFGANASVPVGDAKLSGSAFYTFCDEAAVDYHAMLFRVKGEVGPFMAWVDYNPASDDMQNKDYANTFVWAQYKYSVYESAAGSFSLQPTFRWLTTSMEDGATNPDTSTLRAELWATVTF
jgi:hypothetical protein